MVEIDLLVGVVPIQSLKGLTDVDFLVDIDLFVGVVVMVQVHLLKGLTDVDLLVVGASGKNIGMKFHRSYRCYLDRNYI